jgi:hypothetical protein
MGNPGESVAMALDPGPGGGLDAEPSALSL